MLAVAILKRGVKVYIKQTPKMLSWHMQRLQILWQAMAHVELIVLMLKLCWRCWTSRVFRYHSSFKK